MEPEMTNRASGDGDAGGRRKGAGAPRGVAKPPKRTSSQSAARPYAARMAAKARSDAAEASAPQRGRARALAPASSFLRGAVGDAAAKRGIAETRLLTQWAEIVGADIAAATQPLRLKRRGGLALGGVLAVAVDGPRATEIEHKIPQIIESVNAHYGYRAVAEIALTQAVDGLDSRRMVERRRPKLRGATTEEKRRVAELTDPIGDGALRAALARLGEKVMARAAEKRATSDRPARVSSSGVASGAAKTSTDGDESA